MGVFGITYNARSIGRIRGDKKCHKCNVKLKAGDEGMRIRGLKGKARHYHKKCYEATLQ